jgi:hypothetical protein
MATKSAAQGHTIIDEEEAAVAMNWQSGDSNNNGFDNSGSYENSDDTEEGARKGSDERDSDYILAEEVW